MVGWVNKKYMYKIVSKKVCGKAASDSVETIEK